MWRRYNAWLFLAINRFVSPGNSKSLDCAHIGVPYVCSARASALGVSAGRQTSIRLDSSYLRFEERDGRHESRLEER